MNKVGVIAEYNPFHNGHLYHLNETKKMFPNSIYILILVGNITQRADFSIINKWDKTKIALDFGYDLVVELPYFFSCQAANIYAKAAIDILNILECDYLVFGSELNDISTFCKIVDITNDKKYDALVKKYVNSKNSYAKSTSLALEELYNVKIDKPNDILALEYIRAIKKTNSNIKPVSIKRDVDYNFGIKDNIASASYIRKNINDKNILNKTVPKKVIKYIKEINYDKYFDMLKYEILSSNDLEKYIDVDKSLLKKIKKSALISRNLEELILNIKSKKYTFNKIKRMLNHIVCKDLKENVSFNIKYIRILGFTKNGTKVLKEIKGKTNLPIITKFKKEYENLFYDDIKASCIYSLITDYDINLEYQTSIKNK